MVVADASGSRGLSVVPGVSAEPGEFVLDTDSEVVIVDPMPEEMVVMESVVKARVLSMEICVVCVGELRVEVSPPEEVDVAEDMTAFFCAKPRGRLVCASRTRLQERHTNTILIDVEQCVYVLEEGITDQPRVLINHRYTINIASANSIY